MEQSSVSSPPSLAHDSKMIKNGDDLKQGSDVIKFKVGGVAAGLFAGILS